MEILLFIWIKEKQIAGDSISEAVKYEKIFEASREWFHKFKKIVVIYKLNCSLDLHCIQEMFKQGIIWGSGTD